MKRVDIKWTTVDWSAPNSRLAITLECNVKTVARYRQFLGMPKTQNAMTDIKKKLMTEGRKRARLAGRYDNCYAIKSKKMIGIQHGNDLKIQESHLKYGERHPSAKSHILIAPSGAQYKITNIDLFVRDNSGLFLPEDVVIRKRPSGNRYSRAANGLLSVSNRNKRQWKGWIK